jgi:hypothetical protein
MPSDITDSLLFIAGGVLGLLGLLLLLAGVVALRRGRRLRFAFRTLTGLLLLAVGALALALAIGIQGYRALTKEEVALLLSVRPTGRQRFSATVRRPNGRTAAVYDIAGDEVYVDARILKWKPIANVLGLHTAYELDRLGGRYRDVEHERTAPRSIHALAPGKTVNLFDLRRRHAFLAAAFDAEYGSATFVPVTGPAELEVRVSTTGLLIRPRPASPLKPR